MKSLLLAVDARAVRYSMLIGALLVWLAGVPLAAALNVWIDEAFTLHTTAAGPLVAWSQAILFEGQPPLYFALESLWRAIDENSIAFARLPGVCAAAAAVAVTVAAAHRIVPRIPPLAVALVTAANPIVIWAAVELRVYALVLLISAVLTWAFVAGFAAPRTSGRARALYVVAATAGLYVQYYVGFVLAAQFITLLLLRRSAVRSMAGALSVVALAFAPFVPVVLWHLATSEGFVERATFARALYVVVNAVFVFVLPHEQSWTGVVKAGGIGAALLLVAALAYCRPTLPAAGPARLVGLQWLLSLIVFGAAFGATGVPLQSLRHLIVLVPSSIILALMCVGSLTRSRTLAAGFAAGVFALFAGTQFWAQYHPPIAKIGEWARVGAVLAADRGTPVAVFPAELALPLAYSSARTPIPIPRPMPFTIGYVRATTLGSPSDVARVLEPLGAHAGRLWLVTGGPCEAVPAGGYDYHCGVLERYLQHRYRVERSVAFHGALARLLVRLPDTARAASAAVGGVDRRPNMSPRRNAAS